MLTAELLYAEKRLFFSVLENFLTGFLAYFAGYRVIASERYYSMEKENYYLNGTVDCILEDMREDSPEKNSALIVDFKKNNIPKLEACTGAGEGMTDFQLPAYLCLAEKALEKNVNTALFFSITEVKSTVLFGSIKNTVDGKTGAKKADDVIGRRSEGFTEIMNEFDCKTKQFVNEISAGNFSFFPSDYRHCAECGYSRVCRTCYLICGEKNYGK